MNLKLETWGPSDPVRTHLPVFISKRDLALMAEQMAEAMIGGAKDPNGLKIFVRGRLEELPEVARRAMEDWLKAEVRVLDED